MTFMSCRFSFTACLLAVVGSSRNVSPRTPADVTFSRVSQMNPIPTPPAVRIAVAGGSGGEFESVRVTTSGDKE